MCAVIGRSARTTERSPRRCQTATLVEPSVPPFPSRWTAVAALAECRMAGIRGPAEMEELDRVYLDEHPQVREYRWRNLNVRG
jgi:hypothetical protein